MREKPGAAGGSRAAVCTVGTTAKVSTAMAEWEQECCTDTLEFKNPELPALTRTPAKVNVESLDNYIGSTGCTPPSISVFSTFSISRHNCHSRVAKYAFFHYILIMA